MTIRNYTWRLIGDSNTAFPSTAAKLPTMPDLNPLVTRILLQRGIHGLDAMQGFLYPADYRPAPVGTLPDIDTGAALLWDAIKKEQHILVWGDFDVDGQTATSLLIDGIETLGGAVTYYIPDRVTESHGIQIKRLNELIAHRTPHVLLTCDTGITAHEAVETAVQQGIVVIVTDHHDLPEDGILPPAAANINPKRLPPDHPLRNLPGVGVAYRLMQALYTHAGHPVADLERLLDLVALGIVADVAEQTYDTRYFLQLGMETLRNTERTGLRALYKAAHIDPQHLTTETIGFQLAPRLNAVGRLGSAQQAVQLLTTSTPSEAAVLAAQFDGLNKKRRILQRDTLAAARAILDAQPNLHESAALVLYHPGWHPGLIGIVAGQLAEQYQRPCILLTSEPGDDTARGSARSARNYDIGAAIAAQAELLITHGGHPGAAGLSLSLDNIDRFRRKLSKTLLEQHQGDTPPTLEINAEIQLEEVTEELALALDILAPFGEGNPPVVLMVSNLTLADSKVIGRDRLHRRLTVANQDGTTRQILWWNGMEHRLPEGTFDLAFTVGWNTYQGRRDLALTLRDFRETEAPSAEIPDTPRRAFIDWRDLSEPGVSTEIANLEPDYLVWAEGPHADKDQRHGTKRNELFSARSLVVYTTPPSPAVLNDVLETVTPDEVYIAGLQPEPYTMRTFQHRLQRLCNYTIKREAGVIDPVRLAGALATTVPIAILGLQWLAAGKVIALYEQESPMRIAMPDPAAPPYDLEDTKSALQTALQEMHSYRRSFRRTPVHLLTD